MQFANSTPKTMKSIKEMHQQIVLQIHNRILRFPASGTAVLAIVVLSLLSATLRVAAQSPPVRILDTHGSTNEGNWTQVTTPYTFASPRNIVLDNGFIRITCPPLYQDEKAGHVLWVNIGGVYQLAGDTEFGDWSYAGSSFTDQNSDFTILENNADIARIRTSFHFHRHQYQNNVPFPVHKTIVLRRGSWGYRAMFEVASDLPGEREVGFGGTTTHLFTYTNKMGILWNPYQPPSQDIDDVWVRDTGQASGDWWGASLAFSNSYYRLVSLRPGNPAGLRTGQFPGGLTGNLLHWAFEGFKNYEAFIAAVPYDGSMAARVTVSNGFATVNAPKAGTYSIYTRSNIGRRLTYTPAKTDITLVAGSNIVDVRGISLFAPILVPVSNGVNLPEDISLRYRNGNFD